MKPSITLALLALLVVITGSLPSSALVALKPYLGGTDFNGTVLWAGWTSNDTVAALYLRSTGTMYSLNVTIYSADPESGNPLRVVGSRTVYQSGYRITRVDVKVAWGRPLLAISVSSVGEYRLLIVNLSGATPSVVLSEKLSSQPGIDACCGLALAYWQEGGAWRLEVYDSRGGLLWYNVYSDSVQYASIERGHVLVSTGSRLLVYALNGSLTASVQAGDAGLYSIGYANMSSDGRLLILSHVSYSVLDYTVVYDLENGTVALASKTVARLGNAPRWLGNRTLLLPVSEAFEGTRYRVLRLYWLGNGWANETLSAVTGPAALAYASTGAIIAYDENKILIANTTTGQSVEIVPRSYSDNLFYTANASLSPSGRYLLVAGTPFIQTGGELALFLASAVEVYSEEPLQLELPGYNISFTLGRATLWTDQETLEALVTPQGAPPCIGPEPETLTANITLGVRLPGAAEYDALHLYKRSVCSHLTVTSLPAGSLVMVSWSSGNHTLKPGSSNASLWLFPGTYTLTVTAPPPSPCIGCQGNLTLWNGTVESGPGGSLAVDTGGYLSVLGLVYVEPWDYPVLLRVEGYSTLGPYTETAKVWFAPGSYEVSLIAQPPPGYPILWPEGEWPLAYSSRLQVEQGANMTLAAPDLRDVFPILIVNATSSLVRSLIVDHTGLGQNLAVQPGTAIIVYPGLVKVYAVFERSSDPLTPSSPLLVSVVSADRAGTYTVNVSEAGLMADLVLGPVSIQGFTGPADYTIDNAGNTLTIQVSGSPVRVRVIVSPDGSQLLVRVLPRGPEGAMLLGGFDPLELNLSISPGEESRLDGLEIPGVVAWLSLDGLDNSGRVSLVGPWGNMTYAIESVVGKPLLLPPGAEAALKYYIPPSPSTLPWVHKGTVSLPSEPGTYNITIPGLAVLRLEGDREVRITGPDGKSVTLRGPATLLVPPGTYKVVPVVAGLASLIYTPEQAIVSLLPGETATVAPSLGLNTWMLLGLVIVAAGTVKALAQRRQPAEKPVPVPRGPSPVIKEPEARPEPAAPAQAKAGGGEQEGSGGPVLPGGLDMLYEPLEVLGRGGFSVVMRVRSRSDGKEYALKYPDPEKRADESIRKSFMREATYWEDLGRQLGGHENIVRLVRADTDPYPHLLIEYVPGIEVEGERVRDLRSLINHYRRKGERVPVELAARIALQVARALAHAHEKNIVHLDVKPENILLAPGQGGGVTAKLTDWGTAKLGGVVDRDSLVGYTPRYAAPEIRRLAEGETRLSRVKGESDVYSLGVIIKEMLGLEGGEATLRPGTLEHELAKLAGEMTKENPDDRPSASEVVQRIEDMLRRHGLSEPEVTRVVRKGRGEA